MTHILYSFRRCPYAMRARMGLRLANISWEHREVDLKNKPAHMLELSPKGTVPVLLLEDGTLIDESLDILIWALESADAAHIHSPQREEMLALIQENDSDFKANLDRYKYPTRYEDVTDPNLHRANCEAYLSKLNKHLEDNPYLFGPELSFADIAIFPFIRQFSRVESEWFQSLPYPHLQGWLARMMDSELFLSIMAKHPIWGE